MSELQFKELQRRVIQLTIEGKIHEIQKLLNDTENTFPDHRDKISLWKACLWTSLGKEALALKEIENAIKSGVYWHPDILKDADDLKPLHGYTAFKRMIDICEKKLILKCSHSS